MTTEKAPLPEGTATGPDWTVIDLGSIVISLSGFVFTLLPWGVFQSRLETVDIMLMLTPAFILAAALLSYTGTLVRKKTNGTRNKVIANIARMLIWVSIAVLIVPIMIKFISLMATG